MYAFEEDNDRLWSDAYDQSYDTDIDNQYNEDPFYSGSGYSEAVEYSPDKGHRQWATGSSLEYDAFANREEWESGDMYSQPPPPPPQTDETDYRSNRARFVLSQRTSGRRDEDEEQSIAYNHIDPSDDSVRSYFSSGVIGASAGVGATIYAKSGDVEYFQHVHGTDANPHQPYHDPSNSSLEVCGDPQITLYSAPIRPAPAAPQLSHRRREIDLL